MTIMEIALLIIGVIIFIMSFLLPDSSEKKTEKDLAAEREEVKRIVEQEIDSMRLKVNEAANDTVEYAVGKAERSLERVSNEKIMAVNEYADTIIEEINKNHKEVMFLYDMLRDKQADLSNAVRKADATVKEIEAVSHSAIDASETLLRGMSVATVSQKGLTTEQKSVFDDIVIPDAKPVVFEPHVEPMESSVQSAPVKSAPKRKGAALAQSKILAGLTGVEYHDEATENNPATESLFNESTPAATDTSEAPVKKKAVAYDMLSGSAFKDGSIIGVNAPAAGSVTAADYAAMVSASRSVNDIASPRAEMVTMASGAPITQAPANNNDKIIELSRQGLSTVEIAKALDLGVGEVKLVLDLFK